MMHYTVGFVFNKSLDQVFLIHKLSPDWQKGKINGLGGKYETGEDAFTCISREVEEESGIRINPSDWSKMGELYSNDWSVDIMAHKYLGKESDARSIEKQRVEWFPVNNLPNNTLNNLPWLIPLCLDIIKHKQIITFKTEYIKQSNE